MTSGSQNRETSKICHYVSSELELIFLGSCKSILPSEYKFRCIPSVLKLPHLGPGLISKDYWWLEVKSVEKTSSMKDDLPHRVQEALKIP